MTASSDAHRAIEAVWRIESSRLIAGLTRMTGDIGLAEDLAQDALRLGRIMAELAPADSEARAELERAASLTRNTRERDLLLGRARGLGRTARQSGNNP